jgi:tetratricopeptide (TPR) repeat protein
MEDSTATFGRPNSSHERMVRIARGVFVVMFAAAATIWIEAASQPAAFDIKALLDMYLRGQRDEAVARAAAIPDLGPFRLRYVQDAPVWVNTEPSRLEARSAAGAAFLLEVAAARLESDWGRFSDLIEWTCVQLRTTAQPTRFERAWHVASHALAGRARARQWLLGQYPRLPHQKPVTPPPMKTNERPAATHLMHAIERFPDDPRFQLSRVVAWLWGRDGEPIRNVRRRDDDDGGRRRPIRAPQLEALVTLQPLTSAAEVADEAWIRIGLVHFTVGDFESALRAFESAQSIATSTPMRYLAHFNAGRALEGLQRVDAAMRAYQRALAIVPDAESATIALTSLQFAHDDRDAAVSAIDRVFNRKPGAADPGRLIGYGNFLQWDDAKSAMRAELR